jgi:alpha-L-rhamnosidase
MRLSPFLAPPRVLATAFFAQSTEIVGKMAAVLGREDDAKKYAERAAGIKAAFNKTYVDAEGRIAGNTQAGYALALRFNMLPEAMRAKAAKHMVDEFGRYNGHMSTGIQTSHRLMLELTRNGYHDEAYRLLSLRTIPSWGYMVDEGATTIWERWDAWVDGRGFQKPLMNSFNHWALGAVGEWMWRHIVGLNPDESQAAWKHFTIEPRPGGGLTWARGTYDSIRGTIASDWRLEGGRFHLNVTIPPNTTATVRVPAKDANSVTIDGQPAAASKLIESLGLQNGKAAFQVPSGRYQFVSPPAKLSEQERPHDDTEPESQTRCVRNGRRRHVWRGALVRCGGCLPTEPEAADRRPDRLELHTCLCGQSSALLA